MKLSLGILLVCAIAGSANSVAFSPATTIVTLNYGTGLTEVDTTQIAPGAPIPRLVGAFRVDAEEHLWLLTTASAPEIRCFATLGDSVQLLYRFVLPESVGVLHDFIYNDSVLYAERLSLSQATYAIFYEVQQDSLIREVGLPAAVGYNKRAERAIVSLGRLALIGGRLYDVDPLGDNSIEVGDPSLYSLLGEENLIEGLVGGGSTLSQSTLVLTRASQRLLTLPWDIRGRVTHVDSDGGFVIRETAVWVTEDGQLCRVFAHYDADGQFGRRVTVRDPSSVDFHVGGAGEYFHMGEYTYFLACDDDAVRLLRY